MAIPQKRGSKKSDEPISASVVSPDEDQDLDVLLQNEIAAQTLAAQLFGDSSPPHNQDELQEDSVIKSVEPHGALSLSTSMDHDQGFPARSTQNIRGQANSSDPLIRRQPQIQTRHPSVFVSNPDPITSPHLINLTNSPFPFASPFLTSTLPQNQNQNQNQNQTTLLPTTDPSIPTGPVPSERYLQITRQLAAKQNEALATGTQLQTIEYVCDKEGHRNFKTKFEKLICVECGGRALRKVRTRRIVQFEAR